MTDLVERLLRPVMLHYNAESVNAERREAATEIAALRDIICRSAAAIGNGAAISPECSIEFMSHLPDEIATHTAALREQSSFQSTEVERLTKRLETLAAGFGVPDGGRYIADWQARIEKYKKSEARAETAERERDALRERVKELEKRQDGMIAYSCDLQRIIESICASRPIPKPETDARHHYNMALAYTASTDASTVTAERNLLDLTSLRDMLILCGELGGMRSGEKAPDFLRRIIDGLIDAERKLAEAREALKPFASPGSETWCDDIDNDGVPYQSQWLADALRAARAITGED